MPTHSSAFRPREPRFTTPPRCAHPQAPAWPLSNSRIWSAPTAPGPTPSWSRPPPPTIFPGCATTFRSLSTAWSFQAAVDARWFDTRSKALGDEYRDYIFANQRGIETPESLRQYTETFARSHGIALPFAIDPEGKLAAEVKADYALGQRIGIEHTPTIWVVTSDSKGAPFVEVVDRSKLYQIIDQALADTSSAKR